MVSTSNYSALPRDGAPANLADMHLRLPRIVTAEEYGVTQTGSMSPAADDWGHGVQRPDWGPVHRRLGAASSTQEVRTRAPTVRSPRAMALVKDMGTNDAPRKFLPRPPRARPLNVHWNVSWINIMCAGRAMCAYCLVPTAALRCCLATATPVLLVLELLSAC